MKLLKAEFLHAITVDTLATRGNTHARLAPGLEESGHGHLALDFDPRSQLLIVSEKRRGGDGTVTGEPVVLTCVPAANIVSMQVDRQDEESQHGDCVRALRYRIESEVAGPTPPSRLGAVAELLGASGATGAADTGAEKHGKRK